MSESSDRCPSAQKGEEAGARQPAALSRHVGKRANDADHRRKLSGDQLFVAYIVVALIVLIALRASIDELDFIGVGWLLVLVALPLLPWLLPRLGDFLKEISPYVERVKLGALQLDLRMARRDAIELPSSGAYAHVPNDVSALSSGTTITGIASERIRATMGGLLNHATVSAVETLADADVRTVLNAPYRFVPSIAEGRVTGVIDRETVALAVARAAIARA